MNKLDIITPIIILTIFPFITNIYWAPTIYKTLLGTMVR